MPSSKISPFPPQEPRLDQEFRLASPSL
uniref:Uncharacterized protein n=1 Tax=Arundo donax TaxID=35708 RepID=A0A0A8YD11_ARUDO